MNAYEKLFKKDLDPPFHYLHNYRQQLEPTQSQHSLLNHHLHQL